MLHANRIAGRFYNGVLLVPVDLNGAVFKFVVDCGAAYCAISRKLLDKVVAEPTDFKISIAPVGKEAVVASTVNIENFVVGGMRQKNILISIVDFPTNLQIDGLLGRDFMGKYRITIEPDTQTLDLRQIPKKK